MRPLIAFSVGTTDIDRAIGTCAASWFKFVRSRTTKGDDDVDATSRPRGLTDCRLLGDIAVSPNSQRADSQGRSGGAVLHPELGVDLLKCLFTVLGLRLRISAMSRLDLPRAIQSSTSASRSVTKSFCR